MARRAISLILRTGITLGILAYFLRKLDWHAVLMDVRGLDYRLILAAFMAAGASHVLSAVRWWYLLKVQSITLPLYLATKLTFISQFFNLFLLGSVGGDAVKLLYIVRAAPNQKTHATLSTIMDRVIGMFVMVAFGLAAMFGQIELSLGDQRLEIFVYALMTALSLMVVSFILAMSIPVNIIARWFPGLWRRLPKRHLFELTIAGFHQHGKALSDTVRAFCSAIAAWLLVCVVGILLAKGMALAISNISIALILTLVCLATTLPISIGGHGVREGSFAMLFGIFGHGGNPSQSQAILFSVLFFLAFSLWGLPGGLLYLFGLDKRNYLKEDT